MQEEVENRTLTLVVSGTKFTGRLLKAAISKYMAHCKEIALLKYRFCSGNFKDCISSTMLTISLNKLFTVFR